MAISWNGKNERGQVWGGDDQEFGFRHVEFEIPIQHPDESVKTVNVQAGVQRRG